STATAIASPGAPDTSGAAPTSTGGATATPVVTSTADATSAPAVSETPPRVQLEPATGSQRFDRPIELLPYPGGRFLLADQGGLAILLTPAAPDERAGETTLLDLRDTILTRGTEEGLLSVALDPEFESNGYLYAYFSMANPRRSVLARFEV